MLALRASARGRVPGIVHDSSGSGQTLFVEPFAAVDDSNRLREAEVAERDEVTRILRNLSSLVGTRAGALAASSTATASLDLALACGSLSRSWRGAVVTESAGVVLRGARHPLLDQSAAVPIDLELGELRALVISGPNTGGKTVALKTLGLAAALHQCGLRPPAEEVALPVFDAILVDIGDEQSIAMSLSTFSAHVRNLVGILESATGTSLVLLDEIAAGTDPVEGAALAEALLDALAGQARLTVTTSHYAELKEWASATNGAANAATGIDPESHEPLYTVSLGRPGTSHALQTAERLGLPGSIVAAARGRVAPERLQVAELVAEAEEAARQAQDALAAAAEEQRRAAAARVAAEEADRLLHDAIETVRSSTADERRRALAGAEAELATVRGELEELRAEIRRARKLERERGRATTPAAERKERERDRSLGTASDIAVRARKALSHLDEPLPLTTPLAVGDPVVAAELGIRGTIAEIVGEEATVLGSGGLRVRVPVDRLLPDRHAAANEERAAPGVTVRAMIQNDLPDEIDLRGRTAQEAREAVRDLVDAAVPGRPGRGSRDPRPRHRCGAQGRARRAGKAPARPRAGAGFRRRGDRRAPRRGLRARRRWRQALAWRRISAHSRVGCSPTEERGEHVPLLRRPETGYGDLSRLLRGCSCFRCDLGTSRRQHDECESRIGRMRFTRNEPDPLERPELARDAGCRHREPPRELDAAERLPGGVPKLKQHREVVETDAVMTAERMVDVAEHERASAGEIEDEIQCS